MTDDELLFWDEGRQLAEYWLAEHAAGAIPPSELRRLLCQLLPGSLPLRVSSDLYWDGIVGWNEACRLTGQSPMLSRRALFGTRRAQAAGCGCWFDASNPRELAEPPEWCPDHRPVTRTYRQYLRTDHWVRFSAAEKRRRPICEHCYERKTSDIHHTPEGYQNLWRERTDDVLALCRLCHGAAHGLVVER